VADLTNENIEEKPLTAKSEGLSQQQVNDIVKREKANASDRVRRELEAKHTEELEKLRAELSSNNAVDKEALKKELYDQFLGDLKTHHETLKKEEEEKRLTSIADQYHLKMGKGSELFSDFNEVMGDFKPAEFSNTAMLAAQMEHTPEIMYELANNPGKLAEIEALAERSEAMARKQLEKLSKSIETNIEAKRNNVSVPPPLSQVKSSSVGVDSSKMSLRDLKNAPWLQTSGRR
jgi:hypothetical protein